MGEFYINVAGVTFEGRQSTIARLFRYGELEPGTALLLKRDFYNPHDPNAVGVYTIDGEQLGFIPRDKAQRMALNMLHGVRYRAFVSNVHGGGVDYSYGVTIRIEYT